MDFGQAHSGSHIPRDVAEPPGVASLVCRKVREVREGESSEDPPLRAVDGGTSRIGRHSHPGPQRGAIECDSHEAESQGPAKKLARPPNDVISVWDADENGGVRSVWRRDRGRDERGSSLRGSQFECGSPGDPNAVHGECTVSDSPDAGNHPASNRAPVDQCPSWAQSLHAGDPDRYEDHVSHVTHETNRERRMFNKLVNQISHELDQVIHEGHAVSNKIDVLEVVCGPHSQLTSQCQQLGHRAMRFGLAEGDLQTSEGRQRLFQVLVKHRPRHVWFSPKCGPWSGWSNLNGSKSIEAWMTLKQPTTTSGSNCFGNSSYEMAKGSSEPFSLGTATNSQMFRLSLHAGGSADVAGTGR